MVRMAQLLSIGLLLIAAGAAGAAAGERAALARSTFIHVIDAPGEAIDPRHFTYLPAGTRLQIFPRTQRYRGAERHLMLSEDGLWGFIKAGNFWSGEQLDYFRREGLDVFIQRDYDVLVDISEQLAFRIRFTRGETHHLDAQGDAHYRVAISVQKDLGLPANLLPLVNLPREQAALVDFAALDEQRATDFYAFRRSVFDGISGIRKRCNTEVTTASKVGGAASAGFSLSTFFDLLSAEAHVEASHDSERLEHFAREINVTRSFYTRDGQPGLYKITRLKGCAAGQQQLSFIYTDPNNEEITISREWAEAQGLAVDATTGQVLVSCPEQFFAYRDRLQAHNLPTADLPFLIARTAKFKTLTDSQCQMR